MLRIATLAALALIGLYTPALSQDLTPVGHWQTKTGESRYDVYYCSGEKLCARLVWLRSDARTAENLRYMNTNVVSGARPTAENKWSGTVNYAGEKFGGSVTLVSPGTMRLQSCKIVFCQVVEFSRI